MKSHAITVVKRVTRKITAQSYEINLGTSKVMARARARKKLRETATIVKNLVIKRLIVEKNTLRRNQLSIQIMTPAAHLVKRLR